MSGELQEGSEAAREGLRGEVSSEQWTGSVPCRPLWAMVRSPGFILQRMESQWKVLNRRVMGSDLYFRKCLWAATGKMDGWG